MPLTILSYQRLVARPDPLFPELLDARRFEQHLRLLTRWFRVLPLALAVRQLRARTLPSRAVCITFDNGYADSADVALPLLQRHGASATFFVATGLLDGGRLWTDAVIDTIRAAAPGRLNLSRHGFGVYDIGCPQRRRAVIEMLIETLAALPAPERSQRVKAMTRGEPTRMLCPDQLLALHRAGMDVGAHTPAHTALSAMSNAEARAAIGVARTRLEDLVQTHVSLFSYPYGQPGRDFEDRHANMLRSHGFAAAVTGQSGAAHADTDPFALPRLTPCARGAGHLLLRIGASLMVR